MSFQDTLCAALDSLGTNTLRSLLTILGVIIGVASVILLVGIGNGASQRILSRIESLGANLIFVTPVQRFGGSLTMADAAYIQANVPFAQEVYPVVQSSGGMSEGAVATGGPILGLVPGYLKTRNDTPASGRVLSAADAAAQAKVVDLGAALAQTLFPTGQAVGRSLFVMGQAFRVVGVMHPAGGGFGLNLDNTLFMPITTAQDLLRTNQISSLVVKAPSADGATRAQGMISRLYTQKFGSNQAVVVQSEDQLLSTVSQSRQTFTELLGGTALIALLVGGIGIMNIMLVSVTERTREIGIRKAVGATQDDILAQFLLEAILLSMSGGALGVALALLLAPLLSRVLGFTAVLSVTAMAEAFVFSAAVGVLFGFYPALKASSTYPVEALRQE